MVQVSYFTFIPLLNSFSLHIQFKQCFLCCLDESSQPIFLIFNFLFFSLDSSQSSIFNCLQTSFLCFLFRFDSSSFCFLLSSFLLCFSCNTSFLCCLLCSNTIAFCLFCGSFSSLLRCSFFCLQSGLLSCLFLSLDTSCFCCCGCFCFSLESSFLCESSLLFLFFQLFSNTSFVKSASGGFKSFSLSFRLQPFSFSLIQCCLLSCQCFLAALSFKLKCSFLSIFHLQPPLPLIKTCLFAHVGNHFFKSDLQLLLCIMAFQLLLFKSNLHFFNFSCHVS